MDRIVSHRKSIIVGVISAVLFFIPFFWFEAGGVDLGGDSSRLYFLDQLAYLSNHTLFGVSPSGLGGHVSSFWGLPYIYSLYILRFFVDSPSTLIKVVHGLTISLGFLFVYLSSVEVIKLKTNRFDFNLWISSIIAGLFYILSPRLIINWDKVIMTHSQIFVNPIMFYLLLMYIKSKNISYLVGSLLVSFIFAQNFSYAGAPPFFAFYPVMTIFLVIFNYLILKDRLIIKHIIIFTALFLLLHSFHLIPQITDNFSEGSVAYSAVFSEEGKLVRGLSYFESVAPSVKVSTTLMNLPQMSKDISPIAVLYLVFPFIIIFGIFSKSKKTDRRFKKTILLTAYFFLLSLFLVSANITDIGLKLYKLLFYIPGFSMFRNYFGQWQYLYVFLYSLLVGLSLVILFDNIKKKQAALMSVIFISIIILSSWKFITGEWVNRVLWEASGTRVEMDVDPDYEKTLNFIKNLPEDNKFISLPLADPGYQIISGKSRGAYQGPSSIAYIAGKKDFIGNDDLELFGPSVLTSVRNKDWEAFMRLMGILNIGYIFYNSDTKIYDSTFKGFPYEYVRKFFPSTQDKYASFIASLPAKKVAEFGEKYHVYKFDNQLILPHIYSTVDQVTSNDSLQAIENFGSKYNLNTAFIKTPGIEGRSEVVLIPKNSSTLNDLFDNYHLHTHDPYVSQSTDSIFYHLVPYREKIARDNLVDSPDAYLDMNFLHMAKRISELYLWGDEMNILNHKWDQPKILDLLNAEYYNSWEATLGRYTDQSLYISKWINSSGKSDSWKNKSYIKFNEQLQKNHARILKTIQSSNKSEKEKQYLFTYVSEIFGEMYSSYKIKKYSPGIAEFSLEKNEVIPGEYEVFIKSNQAEFDPENIELIVGDSAYKANSYDPISMLFSLGRVSFSPNAMKKMTVSTPSRNLATQNTWDVSNLKNQDNSFYTLSLRNKLRAKEGGITKEIDEWKSNTQYLVTFEYLTYGKDFIFSLYEKKIDKNTTTSINSYFEKNLNSTKWTKNQTIITSNVDGVDAFLHFSSNNYEEASDFLIRNIEVVEVSKPIIFMKSLNKLEEKKTIPNVAFKKINPTKYKVRIENIKNPFTLVLNDKYNSNWGIFLDNNNSIKNQKIVNQYKELAVTELQHSKEFINNDSFETFFLNEISKKYHFEVNGYANAWLISEKEIGSKNVNLVIELKSQRRFNILLIISSITFVSLVVFLISRIIYKK